MSNTYKLNNKINIEKQGFPIYSKIVIDGIRTPITEDKRCLRPLVKGEMSKK